MDEDERSTRRERIDPRLRAAGWSVQPYRSDWTALPDAAALEEHPTTNGPADYALGAGARILGTVEAKKRKKGTQEVLSQAKRYSKGIAQVPRYQGDYGVPFLYSTNGEQIYFLDARHELNLSRQVAGFHTPQALNELMTRDFDDELSRLARVANHDMLWDYQDRACQAIDKAIQERRRKMLVAMATGTGKTLVMVNQSYRMMKSGVARRVLFLVDRRALAAQAVRAFRSFEAEPSLKFDRIYQVYHQQFQRDDLDDAQKWDPTVLPSSLLVSPQLGDAFVYVCTVQRMSINLFGRHVVDEVPDEPAEEDASRLAIPIHAFDLVIADECHRGYTSKQEAVWRETLDYFDAIKIGLTATPAAHTMAYFEHMAFQYDYPRAVREGHLVDYDAVRIRSDVRINGVFLREGEQVDEVDPETGVRKLDLLEADRQFDAVDVEKKITAPDSNRKILEQLKEYADAHEEQYGRFPKTLIFAANDLEHTSHADQVVSLARQIFGRGDDFVEKITGKSDRPLQAIRRFRNRPKPSIAVTVDLLTTGIDIPDLEFLVFMRPVGSRILFEQMLGRGTRKGEHLLDKDKFVVFDCFNGTLLEYFRNTTGMTRSLPEGDGKSIIKIIDEIWDNVDRDYNVDRLVRRLQRIDKRMSGAARDQFKRFIADGDLGEWAKDLPRMLKTAFTLTMEVLRDPQFQHLLLNYPKPYQPFVVAPGVVDEVESEWLIRGGDGREYRPADYLTAFAAFVQEHRDDVQAMRILLDQPQDWSPSALQDLRDALLDAPEQFTEAKLQRAFYATQHEALIDIISMVKQAAPPATDGVTLLTAEDRADRAVELVMEGRTLTPDQLEWLEYFRLHLVQNLSIDPEDFEIVPVLSDRGGWARASRVFPGELDDLLKALNRELAAA